MIDQDLKIRLNLGAGIYLGIQLPMLAGDIFFEVYFMLCAMCLISWAAYFKGAKWLKNS